MVMPSPANDFIVSGVHSNVLGAVGAVKDAALGIDLAVSVDSTGGIGLSCDGLVCKGIPYNVGNTVTVQYFLFISPCLLTKGVSFGKIYLHEI